MEDKLFDLVGLGVPFYLAAATYGVFIWLDTNASDEATQVISSWLHGHSHDKPDLGNLIISAFDRIYTSPLLTFRAFRRSAAISTVIWLLVFFIPSLLGRHDYQSDYPNFPFYLCIAVLSDYISLPFVRGYLGIAQLRPIFTGVVASIIGIGVVKMNFLIFVTVIMGMAYCLQWYPSGFSSYMQNLFETLNEESILHPQDLVLHLSLC